MRKYLTDRCRAKDQQIYELLIAHDQLLIGWESVIAEIILRYGDNMTVDIEIPETGKFSLQAEPLEGKKVRFEVVEKEQV